VIYAIFGDSGNAGNFVRLEGAKLRRLAKEGGGRIIRLSFEDQKGNHVQLEFDEIEAAILKERLNKRKDI
jgi:hypothetical protein